MKIKVSEATPLQLDWLVAEREGQAEYFNGTVWLSQGGVIGGIRRRPFSPSTNWAQGGPIIEREKIGIQEEDGVWSAYHPKIRPKKRWWRSGATPLIAAMRCYVASELGDEVEIPDELFHGK